MGVSANILPHANAASSIRRAFLSSLCGAGAGAGAAGRRTTWTDDFSADDADAFPEAPWITPTKKGCIISLASSERPTSSYALVALVPATSRRASAPPG